LEDPTNFDWCIDKLCELRNQWINIRNEREKLLSRRDRFYNNLHEEAILEQFRRLAIEFYIPKDLKVFVSLPMNKPVWLQSTSWYYSNGVWFDNSIFKDSYIQDLFIEHPKDFIGLIEAGIDRNSKASQEERYQELRTKAENMLTMFAPVLISNEFL